MRTRTAVLNGQVIDDWFFGVSAVSMDGRESPVELASAARDTLTLPAKGHEDV